VLPDGAPFRSEGQLTILSEIIVPGDIQMTGDGVPYVLLNDCQTTGGYPRIGTVLPCDLPRVAQALPGAVLRFAFVSADEGRAALRQAQAALAALPRAVAPLVRDPHQMPDLLSYNLVDGVVSALAPEDLPDAQPQPTPEREAR
jgi:allophanate hydrolase